MLLVLSLCTQRYNDLVKNSSLHYFIYKVVRCEIIAERVITLACKTKNQRYLILLSDKKEF